MQSVLDAFSVEEIDSTRKIAHGVQVSWKKDYRSTISFFTIGVSTIGGPDVIPGPAGVHSAWNRYLYYNESAYAMNISYERSLNQPVGGMVKALADVKLDNTSGRFTPRYSGGSSEIFTAILPRRPVIVNAGFNYNGIDNMIPQFVGVTTKAPKIDFRSKTVELNAADFIDFIQNQYVDDAAMFTGLRSDQVIENILVQLGFSTSQYELDYGINRIGFGEFQVGDKFSDIINKIVQAENAHFYQDEEGVLRFENRQHWSNYPHYDIQRIITTAQVVTAQSPNDDHIINVVEIKSKPRSKQVKQIIWKLSQYIEVPAGGTKEVFANFDDPVLSVDSPSFYQAFSNSDGTGTDLTASISVNKFYAFARAAKITFANSSTSIAYITTMTLYGRPAKVVEEIYHKEQDDSSVTAYEERIYTLENEYIQDRISAQSIARMILTDFSDPENLQEITIRAIPELQLGDLISWQGHYWRIFGIKTKIDPTAGFLQELKLLQRSIKTYFRIGISTIGGSDQIGP